MKTIKSIAASLLLVASASAFATKPEMTQPVLVAKSVNMIAVGRSEVQRPQQERQTG